MSAREIPKLHELPLAWKGLITCFLLLLGSGYFVAQLNVLARNQYVDGKPGLGFRDLLLKYHGGRVTAEPGEALPSRMLEMIQGSMRQYFQNDHENAVLLGWLRNGATREAFTAGDEPTPSDVMLTCLRCHAADSGEDIAKDSPFGPDMFDLDFDLVARHTLSAEPGASSVWRPPTAWEDLAMTTHAHIFSVPTFVIMLGGLFLWSGWPSGLWRTYLGCAPLALFFAELASWWLARIPGIGAFFAIMIGVFAAAFGIAYLFQWVIVMLALWRPAALQTK